LDYIGDVVVSIVSSVHSCISSMGFARDTTIISLNGASAY